MAGEKNEAATPRRIKKAREDGQVPSSRDFARLAILLAVGEMAFAAEPYWRTALQSIMLKGIASAGKPFLPALAETMGMVRLLFAIAIAAFFVVGVVIAFAANWGQFGPLISTKSIKLDFSKLNPVANLGQLFSQKKLIELLMTIGKTVVIAMVMYFLIRRELPNIIGLSGGTPKDTYNGFITILHTLFHIILGIFLGVCLIDMVAQRLLHLKSLRMDKEEIKKEFKENEGDPLIKGKRKQQARDLANSDPVAATEKANALVVNPTHFAVGLYYDQSDATTVPIVIAKGKDAVAQAMIAQARRCGIPVIRHVWLARTLYATCPPFSVVPRSSYEAVAMVFAVVMELLQRPPTERTLELESEGIPPASATAV